MCDVLLRYALICILISCKDPTNRQMKRRAVKKALRTCSSIISSIGSHPGQKEPKSVVFTRALWMDRRTDGLTDQQTNGPMDRRTDGQTEPLIEMHSWRTHLKNKYSQKINVCDGWMDVRTNARWTDDSQSDDLMGRQMNGWTDEMTDSWTHHPTKWHSSVCYVRSFDAWMDSDTSSQLLEA